MTRTVVFAIIILLIVAGGIADYYWYRAQQPPSVAEDIVKNASLRIDDCMSYHVQPSNTTYAEMLEKLQRNVTEIDSRIIDLRSAQTATNALKLQPLVDYLHAGIDVLRAQAMVVRKEMEALS